MNDSSGAAGSAAVRAFARAAGFLVLWLVLAGADPADLPAAAVAVVAATWTSLRLLPPGSSRLAPSALAKLTLRFASQSVAPGFVRYPVRFPPGPARNAFATLTSLLPGTVPAGAERGHIIYHCLDVEQPVMSQLAAEEAALARALGHD
jgi:multicomponent Na+:H+ antiporter subunit E